MPTRAIFGAFALALGLSPSLSAGDLTLTMRDGKVTLVAANVPLRQVLAEWARIGQTKIIGAERLPGAAVTLELRDVPERRALETLLRAASGYVVAPRAVPIADASLYDRVMILPTSSAPPMAAGPAGRTGTMPVVAAPPPPDPMDMEDQPIKTETNGEDEDEEEVEEEEADSPPVVNPYASANQPPETTFDYANPQLMLQQRQQMMAPGGAISPGMVTPGAVAPAPATFPGTVATPAQPSSGPQAMPGAAAGTTTGRPGEIVTSPATTPNPYGLPPGVQPGSVVGAPVEPDRAKYMNPYQPRPPDQH